MKTFVSTIILFILVSTCNAETLTQQQEQVIISEAVEALSNINTSNNTTFIYDDAYWEKAFAIIFKYPKLADEILAALDSNENLKKAVTKEIKWREFICSHSRYDGNYSSLMRYQNTMIRLTQHSFREKGQHTIHDTLQTGCNRTIYEGDNPATTRLESRIQRPEPPSGS